MADITHLLVINVLLLLFAMTKEVLNSKINLKDFSLWHFLGRTKKINNIIFMPFNNFPPLTYIEDEMKAMCGIRTNLYLCGCAVHPFIHIK